MELDPAILEKGTDLLLKQLQELIAQSPDLGTIHNAFQAYSTNRYSLGSSANTVESGGKGDLGIDFYSSRDRRYVVGQCKVPAQDYLEANPSVPKIFGPSVVNDPRDALQYLFGESTAKPNDRVKTLYAHVQADRNSDDFLLTFHLLVYGRLNERATNAFEALKAEYAKKDRVILQLRTIDDFAGEFVLGSDHTTGKIEADLGYESDYGIMRAKDYCYFLANAADLFDTFRSYGWRLFDLNVRYEIKNSPINGDIVRSLSHAKSRKRFHHFNNGLIVVAKSYAIREDKGKKQGDEPRKFVHLLEPQIVNGLQTVKSIYNAVASGDVTVEELRSECLIQMKVIQTGEADFVAKVVQSTNNQNPMSARNLKGNTQEQRLLRAALASLSPSWFLQVKEGEWESITDEGGRFFEAIVGQSMAAFKPNPRLKRGRIIDNQDAAKAWLAFLGFADKAGDRVTHFFADPDMYDLAFGRRPTSQYWSEFADRTDFDKGRDDALEYKQGDASQYLLAYALLEFVKAFVPSPQRFREQALNEGVKAGRIEKRSGQFVSPPSVQEAYLADNTTYQTWRLMSNMKEVLVESAAHILARRYGPLNRVTCSALLATFDLKELIHSGDLRDVAVRAASATDFETSEVFGRVFNLLRFAATQYWEEKKKSLLAVSRLRTYLLRRDVAREFNLNPAHSPSRNVGQEANWRPSEAILVS